MNITQAISTKDMTYSEKTSNQILLLNKIFVTVLSLFIVFKSIFTYLNIEALGYVVSFIFLFINLQFLTLTVRVPSKINMLIPFCMSGILSFIISIMEDNILIGGVGLIGTYFYMTFWIISFSSINSFRRKEYFGYYVNLSVILAVVTAFFAIYQYFIDPTLFGVNPSQRYSDVDSVGITITRRATSYLGSPQNLGIYFGLMIGCLTLVDYKKVVKILLYLLFIGGGILSGSSAFIMFLFIFYFAYNYRPRDIRGSKGIFKIMCAIVLLLILFYIQYIENIGNTIWQALQVLDSRVDEGLLNTYKVDSLFSRDFLQYVFGNGIGSADRLVEVVTNENPPENWIPGTESYLVKVFFELGLLGGISFIILYGTSLFYAYKSKTAYGKTLFAILLGLISNMAGAPSFTGLSMSFIAWPFIIFPFYCSFATSSLKKI